MFKIYTYNETVKYSYHLHLVAGEGSNTGAPQGPSTVSEQYLCDSSPAHVEFSCAARSI